MEKYFCEKILEKIDNIANLYIAYFLFEGAVYGLIKRRDPYKKSNARDITGLDFNNINYANSSQQLNYNEDNLNKRSESNPNLGKNGIIFLNKILP